MINTDLTFIILEILMACGLFILADLSVKYEDSRWRLLYLVPVLLCLVILWSADMEKCMIPAYLASAVMAAGFFCCRKAVRKCACVLGLALTLLGAGICVTSPGYRAPDFVKAFQDSFATMKEYYCLAEHKGIDWDALYAEYLPKFEAADARHDRAENIILWKQFTDEFHDGHVGFDPSEQKDADEAMQRALGNDYGLSLLRLTDGRIVAANVEQGSAAWEAGIRNGSEILKWDGQVPDSLTDRITARFFTSPDIENEAFYDILYVAGIGGDSVTVDFVDTEGKPSQVTLNPTGFYCDRLLDTLDILDQGMNVGTLTWHELTEDTVLFRVKDMSYDLASYSGTDYTAFKQELEEKILQYAQEGKTKLIIDLRCNGGGSPFMILAMAEMFAGEGNHFYAQYGVLDEKTCKYLKDETTGRYLTGGSLTYPGRDLWSHGEIILLVNGRCISAGDHFTQIMSGMDNVTVMGLTKTNASGQAVTAVDTGVGTLTFSLVPAMDENGEIFIDPGPDRISKIPLDVRVPLDESAVRMLFDEGEDYVLWYALQE